MNYDTLKVAELRAECKTRGITGYSKLPKDKLIRLLEAYDRGGASVPDYVLTDADHADFDARLKERDFGAYYPAAAPVAPEPETLSAESVSTKQEKAEPTSPTARKRACPVPQNIPIRTEAGERIRKAFDSAQPKLPPFDYASEELRVAAQLGVRVADIVRQQETPEKRARRQARNRRKARRRQLRALHA